MFDRAKYVIMDGLPIIVHPGIYHNSIKVADHMIDNEVTSAGFVEFNKDSGRFECFGESVSLGIKSNPERDSHLVNKMLDPNYEY